MKKLHLYSFALLMISALGTSSIPVMAQEDNSVYCAGLPGREQIKLDKFTAHKSAKDDRWSTADQTRFDGRAKADTVRKSHRDGIDRAFTAEINLLLKLAGSNEAKIKAVKDFEATITLIRTTRRSAADSARSTFHTEKDQAITTRRNAINAAFTARTTAFQVAFDKAEADCAAKVPVATVKAELEASLTAARTAFRTTMDKAIQDAQTSFAAARTKLTTAIKAATDTAQAGRAKAKQDFKTAWDAAGE